MSIQGSSPMFVYGVCFVAAANVLTTMAVFWLMSRMERLERAHGWPSIDFTPYAIWFRSVQRILQQRHEILPEDSECSRLSFHKHYVRGESPTVAVNSFEGKKTNANPESRNKCDNRQSEMGCV